MLNWCKAIIRVPVCFLIIAILAPIQRAEPQRPPCTDYYKEAIDLLQAFYPGLSGKGVTLDIITSVPFEAKRLPAAFYVRVSERHFDEPIRNSGVPNPSSADRVGHLSTYFQFDGQDNRIVSVFASGSFANTERQQSLTKLIDEHRGWSEAQMAEALSSAGGKFGPDKKDNLLAKFPKIELESMLGKIEIRSAQFEFRRNEDSPSHARMEWSVRFRASRNPADEYFVAMEPFDGKIVMFGRTPFPVESK